MNTDLARTTAGRLLDIFRAGTAPKALAQVLIARSEPAPCRRWSWGNQILTALADTRDARGFRQWLDAGRVVRAGCHAFHILGPIVARSTKTDPDTGAEELRARPVGFKAIPVFRIEDTEVVDAALWEKDDAARAAGRRHVEGLPLLDVARAWGLRVVAERTEDDPAALGVYSRSGIHLNSANLATWAHELVHAADDRCMPGGLVGGQHADQEIVAELGSAVLLSAIGLEEHADAGGAWEYIDHYAKKAGLSPLVACEQLVTRVCDAVALILDTAASNNTAAQQEVDAA